MNSIAQHSFPHSLLTVNTQKGELLSYTYIQTQYPQNRNRMVIAQIERRRLFENCRTMTFNRTINLNRMSAKKK